MWVSLAQPLLHKDTDTVMGTVLDLAVSPTLPAKATTRSPITAVNYGCWFYMAHDASNRSRTAVNVGQSIRFTTRCAAHRFFYNSTASANTLCTHNPGDRFWCTFASQLGYDSIQIQRGTAYFEHTRKRRPWSELIVCRSPCNITRFSANACVPFAERVDKNQIRKWGDCECSYNASQLSC